MAGGQREQQVDSGNEKRAAQVHNEELFVPGKVA
jgi:hypothetical protein